MNQNYLIKIKVIQNAFQNYKQNLNDKKELEEQKDLAK